MKMTIDNIIVSYDEDADVLRVSRKDISRASINLDKDVNTTLLVDLEQRAVAGLIITNFSLAYPDIYKKLVQKETSAYMISQIEIVLSKLTDNMRLDEVVQREVDRSPVDQVLKSTLVGC